MAVQVKEPKQEEQEEQREEEKKEGPPVIQTEDLRKTYPDGTEALKGISFEVRSGEFFGFLGPNGAGKSTTIKILVTLIDKTGGTAKVLGYDTSTNPQQIRERIGYAAQETGIDDDLTGRENLTLQGRLYRIPSDRLKKRVADLLDLMDLTKDADRPAGTYSGGMRKRLDLATGLVHQPLALFLDEPTTGLDPQSRRTLWQYLRRLNEEEGLTILLTTHYMEEADELCNRLAIIDHGRIIAGGTPESLKAELGGDVIALSFQGTEQQLEQWKQRVQDTLRGLDFVNDLRAYDQGVNVIVRDGSSAVPEVLHALDRANIQVSQLTLTRPTLDDVFLKYTGYSIRDEETGQKRHPGFLSGRRRRRP